MTTKSEIFKKQNC